MISSTRLRLGMRVLLCIGFEIFVTTAQNTIKGIPDSFTSAIYNSTECAPRKTCAGNLTFPDINCNCDPLCTIFNDCCMDYNSTAVDDISMFDKSFFECRQLRDLKGEKGYYLVSHCPLDWGNDNFRMLCELDTVSDDFLVQTPVTKLEGIEITFKNRYCALCNHQYDFYTWQFAFNCTEVYDCQYVLRIPNIKHRYCPLNLISSCGERTDDLLAESCENGQYYMVVQYSTNSTQLYRNEYCAECHGASVTALSCKLFKSKPLSMRHYDYSVLVDLNQETIMPSSYFRNESEPQCSSTEVYDYKYNICREILCPHNLKPKNRQCVKKNSAGTREDSCTWSKLLPSEYEIDESRMLTIVDTKLRLNNSEYIKNQSKIFICKKEAQLCTGNCKNDDRFTYVSVEFSITIVGLIISIVSLLLTLLIYGAFQTLRNTPGKIVIFLAVSLIMGQISFLVSMFVEHIPELCKITAVITHFSFLASFCWMNVMAVDLCRTFSNSSQISATRRSRRALLLYSMYGWMIPAVLLVLALVFEYGLSSKKISNWKPSYGTKFCWINTYYGLLLFFIGPLVLFKSIDVVSFIFTAVCIVRAHKHGSAVRRKKIFSALWINVKISLVIGLPWLFAFLGNAVQDAVAKKVIRYMFIIFNSLQGLFIGISFLCTGKVNGLLHQKYGAFVSSAHTLPTTKST